MKRLFIILLCVFFLVVSPVNAWVNMAVGDSVTNNASAVYMTNYMSSAVDNVSSSHWNVGTYPTISGTAPYSNHWIKIYSLIASSKIRLRSVNGNEANVSYWIVPSSGSGSWCNTTHSGGDTFDECLVQTWGTGYITVYPATAAQWAGLTDIQENSEASIAIANFTGSPVQGTGPLTVTFTDTSLNVTAGNWSSSPNTGVYFDTPNGLNTGGIFTLNGNYTITHGVSNVINSDIETKTDYIQVYNSTDMIKTGFMAIDGVNGYPINGAQVDIEDIENASWTNTTTTGGFAEISTLIGHTLNAYGSASGYADGDLLNQPAINQKLYSLIMWPTNMPTNVSAGNVTVYVYIKDCNTGAAIPYAGVRYYGSGGAGGGADFSVMASSEGIAHFTAKNQTDYHLMVSKTGYTTVNQVVATGTGNGGSATVTTTVLLCKTGVTTVPTATTLPGGGTPTVTQTVDPYSLLSDEEKENVLADTVLNYGPLLVNLFILVTIIGAVKLIAK